MQYYRVTVTRDLTEQTQVIVRAPDSYEAEKAAMLRCRYGDPSLEWANSGYFTDYNANCHETVAMVKYAITRPHLGMIVTTRKGLDIEEFKHGTVGKVVELKGSTADNPFVFDYVRIAFTGKSKIEFVWADAGDLFELWPRTYGNDKLRPILTKKVAARVVESIDIFKDVVVEVPIDTPEEEIETKLRDEAYNRLVTEGDHGWDVSDSFGINIMRDNEDAE